MVHAYKIEKLTISLHRGHAGCLVGLWLFVMTGATAAPIAGGDAAPTGQAGRHVLHGHVPSAVPRLKALGRLPSATNLNLAIGLPLRNPAGLGYLLRQMYDPASPQYRHYLTPEQFTDQFGPTKADYQAVIQFAEAHGLRVTCTHPNRVVLDVAGSVANIERALHVTMCTFAYPTEARAFHAPDREPSLDLPLPILHISGLDSFALPRPRSHIEPAAQTGRAAPNSGSGTSGSYRGDDFRAAYVPGTTLTGVGQSVALLQYDGYYDNDIASYISQCGISTSVILTNIAVDGGISTPGSDNNEVCLDIEMAIAMAPGLTRIYVYEAPNPSPWVDLLSRMANDNLA